MTIPTQTKQFLVLKDGTHIVLKNYTSVVFVGDGLSVTLFDETHATYPVSTVSCLVIAR